MFSKINLDAVGITASLLCAIHCAILPLLMASLPILGIDIIHNSLFEYGMIGLAFAVGTAALWHGFNRHHRRPTPWLLFVAGMIFLIAKEIWPVYELGLLPLAVLFILAAHGLNYHWCRTHARRPAPKAHPDTGGIPAEVPSLEPDFSDPAAGTAGNLLTLQD